MDEDDDFDWDNEPHSWVCQSCGFKDLEKPMPADREKYYRNPKAAKCKHCKSMDLMPQSWG